MSSAIPDSATLVGLPDHLVAFRIALRRFVDEELIPLERQPELDPESRGRIERRARELGIWAAAVPAEHGGAGFGALAYAVMCEELARSVHWSEVEGLGSVMPPLLGGNPDQVERYVLPSVRGERIGAFALTEPTGGSDPVGAMSTTAVKDGASWILNGRKVFITRAAEADHFVVFAVTDKAARHHGITAFIVDRDTPGFSVVRLIDTMGTHRPGEIELQDVVVGDEQRLGELGEGFALAQRTLGGQRVAIGARAVGICTRLLELAIDYGRVREVFGQPLGAHGQFQAALAGSAIDVEAARWFVYRVAGLEDSAQDIRVLASAVKVHASELVSRVADAVLQVHGGWGYSRDLPIERMYRDSRMFRIVEGPNEVHLMAVARRLLADGLSSLDPCGPS